MKSVRIHRKSHDHSTLPQLAEAAIPQKALKSILYAALRAPLTNYTPTRRTDQLLEELETWRNNEKEKTASGSQSQVLDLIIAEFHRYLLAVLDIGIEQANSKRQGESQVRILVGSTSRKRLRITRDQETGKEITSHNIGDYEASKAIFELKDKNKKLQRKILMLSEEFKKLKDKYEDQIERYKHILNQSLINLQDRLVNDGIDKRDTMSHKASQGRAKTQIYLKDLSRHRVPSKTTFNRETSRKNFHGEHHELRNN